MMFDQPPLNATEVFGRGFVESVAAILMSLVMSLVSMLPSRYRLYLGATGSLGTTVYLVWPVLGTIGCLGLLFWRDERSATYRAGVLASYGLYLASIIAFWAATR